MAEAIRSVVKLRVRLRGASMSPYVYVRIDRPPVNVAFEVSLRRGEGELKLKQGWIACDKDGYKFALLHSDDIEALGGGTVDVVLRASGVAARRTMDLFEIWDGELVFKDVPVQPNEGNGEPG
jgi:hypothetical protein